MRACVRAYVRVYTGPGRCALLPGLRARTAQPAHVDGVGVGQASLRLRGGGRDDGDGDGSGSSRRPEKEKVGVGVRRALCRAVAEYHAHQRPRGWSTRECC